MIGMMMYIMSYLIIHLFNYLVNLQHSISNFMSTKAKIIIITSVSIICGTAFYFLFWRKRKGVSAEDAQELRKYKVEEQPVNKEEVAKVLTQIPLFI